MEEAVTAHVEPWDHSDITTAFDTTTEVVNLSALKVRALRGLAETGERRQSHLQTYIELAGARGTPVQVGGDMLADCDESNFWKIERCFNQLGGVGASWLQDGPGIPSITRESRSAALSGLPAGEVDLKCAAIQCVGLRVKTFAMNGEMDDAVAPLMRYTDNSSKWRANVGDYYDVGGRQNGFSRGCTHGALSSPILGHLLGATTFCHAVGAETS